MQLRDRGYAPGATPWETAMEIQDVRCCAESHQVKATLVHVLKVVSIGKPYGAKVCFQVRGGNPTDFSEIAWTNST